MKRSLTAPVTGESSRELDQLEVALRRALKHASTVVNDMLAYIKRTTVKIPEGLDARLRHEAERRGVTISEVSREALEAYLVGPPGRRRLSAAKAGSSGRSDVSERIEEILANEVER